VKWASSSSSSEDLARAVDETAECLEGELPRGSADLVTAFVSTDHAERYDELPRLLERRFPGAVVLGCSAQSVIGGGRELEDQPGLALCAARLPGVELHPFHLDPATLPQSRLQPELFPVTPGQRAHFLMLADPFSVETERLLRCLDTGFPGSVKFGGLASGGQKRGENALLSGGRHQAFGLVGVAFTGALEIEPVVAQGCRPVGQPLFVTRSRDNLLLQLDGQSPAGALQALYESLSERDRELARHSLFLGAGMREQTEYAQGDFLIRNLIGMDDESGAIAIAADLEGVRVVQFHLRDAETSAEDLDSCLKRYADQCKGSSAAGALLFSCLGRGQRLYGEPDHDSRAFRRHLGAVPLTGFFCNGEIGPVQDRTYLHGYTSSFAIFREP
jgi:small ligand-binding sensory domain FIST